MIKGSPFLPNREKSKAGTKTLNQYKALIWIGCCCRDNSFEAAIAQFYPAFLLFPSRQ